MTKLEELEKELKAHWKNTKEKRKRTHTKALYEKCIKNKKYNDKK